MLAGPKTSEKSKKVSLNPLKQNDITFMLKYGKVTLQFFPTSCTQTYSGSEIICKISSGKISTSFGRQFVAMLHFIQLNVFGDEFSVLSSVSALSNHRHDHFVRQLKRLVVIYKRKYGLESQQYSSDLKRLPSFMTIILLALVLSIATMAKSLKHKAIEHSIFA